MNGCARPLFGLNGNRRKTRGGKQKQTRNAQLALRTVFVADFDVFHQDIPREPPDGGPNTEHSIIDKSVAAAGATTASLRR
jgi:hypothetical protein